MQNKQEIEGMRQHAQSAAQIFPIKGPFKEERLGRKK